MIDSTYVESLVELALAAELEGGVDLGAKLCARNKPPKRTTYLDTSFVGFGGRGACPALFSDGLRAISIVWEILNSY